MIAVSSFLFGSAATATTAATAGLIGSAGSLTFGGVLSAGFTALSAFSSIETGEIQAANSRAEAAVEEAQGAQEAADTKRQLLHTLAMQGAQAGARGLALSSRTFDIKEEETKKTAERSLDVTRFNTDTRAGFLRAQAREQRRGGLLSATAKVGKFVQAGVERGATV